MEFFYIMGGCLVIIGLIVALKKYLKLNPSELESSEENDFLDKKIKKE